MINSYLAHHGILGMKWGVRRYQNEDGSLTSAGKKRYAKSIAVVDNAKEGLKRLRDAGAHEYAIKQNNYDTLKEAQDDSVKNGWTLEEQRKKYPYMQTGMDFDRRTAEYYKSQVSIIDAMSMKVNDIDVTKQSFSNTVKLIDDIFDNGEVSMKQIKDDYVNSSEYKKYQQMLKKSMTANNRSIQNIHNKYSI